MLARCLLSCLMVLARREVSKDAELLVLRHENAAPAAPPGPLSAGRSAVARGTVPTDPLAPLGLSLCASAQAAISSLWTSFQSPSGNASEAPHSPQVIFRAGMGLSITLVLLPGFANRSRCPLTRGRTSGSGQGPSPRRRCRRACPAGAPPPRHLSHRAGFSPSRRPGTSWKLRNLRR
jgi:hypothetical protein